MIPAGAIPVFITIQGDIYRRDSSTINNAYAMTTEQLQAFGRKCFEAGWEQACKWYVQIDERDIYKEKSQVFKTFDDFWSAKEEGNE